MQLCSRPIHVIRFFCLKFYKINNFRNVFRRSVLIRTIACHEIFFFLYNLTRKLGLLVLRTNTAQEDTFFVEVLNSISLVPRSL